MFLPLLLLPLLLQRIGGYPAIETGYLLLPRGVGSVLGLLVMSRLRDRIDPRPVLFFGLAATAIAAWHMGQWTVEVRPWDVVWTNFLQGCATSAIWAPLNTLTLSRLEKRVQDQGYGLFYLSFDIGYAIGAAAIVGLHARFSQINHAVLTEHVTPFNELFRYAPVSEAWPLFDPGGLATIELEIARQSAMIAYNNSFMIIAALIAVLIPFILLFRHPRKTRAAAAA